MKKLLSVLLFLMIFSASSFAEGRKVGVLAQMNTTEEEFKVFNAELRNSENFEVIYEEPSTVSEFVFFDSLNTMIMALNSEKIDEILLPQSVANYVMNAIDKYVAARVFRIIPISLSFGFREGDELIGKFNEALREMKADGTLAELEAKYISNSTGDNFEPVNFEKYDDEENTVQIAVTGDLPPIDYVTADGKPAGFNTAIIAEISKRLKINVELVNIHAGSRAASLSSERSDVIFWIQNCADTKIQPDLPEGVALSEPYYTFNEIMHIAVKK